MGTILWSIGIGIAAIWGHWDWRIAVTGWIVALGLDVLALFGGLDYGEWE